MSVLVAGEIQHGGGDIDAGQFGIVAAQFAKQPALAGQPCGLGLDQAAGFPHVHPDQLRAYRGGDLRGPPQDMLALRSTGHRDDDPLGINRSRCPARRDPGSGAEVIALLQPARRQFTQRGQPLGGVEAGQRVRGGA